MDCNPIILRSVQVLHNPVRGNQNHDYDDAWKGGRVGGIQARCQGGAEGSNQWYKKT